MNRLTRDPLANQRVVLQSHQEIAIFCAKMPPNVRVQMEPLLTTELNQSGSVDIVMDSDGRGFTPTRMG